MNLFAKSKLPVFIAAAVGLSVTLPAEARQGLTRDGAYQEPFSYIGGVRQMSDGRLMIADPLEKSLILLDLDRGTTQALGREGGGPQEFRQPDAVYALGGDTTLLVDLGNSRFTIVNPDGSFGETKPLTSGQPGTPSFMMMLPEAVDRSGNVYFQARIAMGAGLRGSSLPDSGAVVRMNWASGAVDTLGMIKLAERKRSTQGSSGNQRVSISQVPLSPQDDWDVGPQGRIAFVRSSPYRVEWVDRVGRVTTGPVVPVEPTRLRRADQEAWLVEPAGGGMQIGISNNNGVVTTQMSRVGGSSDGRGEISDYEWPETVPIFRAGRSRVDLNGNVWVERYSRAGEPGTFDVFGPDGALKHSIARPEGRRIVGFGEDVVYMVYSDEFDLQYLERYRVQT